MFDEHPERTVLHFGLTFKPVIGYARRLSEAVEQCHSILPTIHWSGSPERYWLRDTEKRFYVAIEFHRLLYVGLGLRGWSARSADVLRCFRSALEHMGVGEIQRAGFRSQTYTAMEMTHAEICDLMFGSFLLNPSEYDAICGRPDDVMVRLHGAANHMNVKMEITPFTQKQAADSVAIIPGIELLAEPRLFDDGLKRFRDSIASDCLFVDVDLSRDAINADALRQFVSDAYTEADRITEASVYRVKRLQPQKGERRGSPK